MKYSLIKKIVAGITCVSIVTYGCSAAFIFYLKDIIAPNMSPWLYLSIVLLLGVFWSGLLGWLGAIWLIKPLLRLTAAANEAATGNLQVEIPVHRSDDEIRLLGLSFETMIAGLRQMIIGISGNISFTHSHAGVLSGGMAQAAQQMEQIAAATDTISNGAREQSRSAQATLTTVGQIRQAAGEIGNKAYESRILSKEMLETIGESEAIVRSMVDGMMNLASSNRESIVFTGELRDNAKEIRSISRVVGEISDQTHLLALNASIEAARAGDYGQGFAVVAGEVRKLAEQSSNAVQHINKLINRMESVVAVVVDRTSAQEQLATRESGNGEAAKAALDRISLSVQATAKAVEDIAASIAVQNRQVENALVQTNAVGDIAAHILTEINQVASSVQEQMSVMQELSASSDMLKGQADDLNAKIHVFRL